MKDGKISYRSLAVILAVVMLFSSAVGGTIAWLIAKTDPVVNTFTYGDIDLALEETKVDEDGNPVDKDGNVIDPESDVEPAKTKEGNEYKMIPGESYLKDPKVTVEAGSEECWLFVKLVEERGFEKYLTYAVNNNVWTQLQDAEGNDIAGVYYCRAAESDTAQYFEVLADNKVTVKEDVTKEMLNALDGNGTAEAAGYPSLSVTAYAVQYSGFEIQGEGPTASAEIEAALKAWAAIEDQNSTP